MAKRQKVNGEADPQLTSAQDAVAEAAKLLGPVFPATAEALSAVLTDIREHYQIAEDAKARWEAAKETAKSCRDLYERAIESLLASIAKSGPAEAPLPLFDTDEGDQALADA